MYMYIVRWDCYSVVHWSTVQTSLGFSLHVQPCDLYEVPIHVIYTRCLYEAVVQLVSAV